MGEHFALCVNRLITPDSVQSLQGSEPAGLSKGVSGSQAIDPSASVIDVKEDEDRNDGETEPLIGTLECRICQEEDTVKNLEVPCACNGSLKYAHRRCVQRWCNEKGDIICEICNQSYQPGYTAPPSALPEETTIEISGGWPFAAGSLDLNDPQVLAMAAAERRLLEAEYDEYADSSTSGAAFCRSAALILMALLLLRHALTLGNGDGDDGDDDDISAFSLFLLRAAGFLLPCYIMAWAISILQRRRQRQEASAMAAAEVAFLLQAGQNRGFQVTVAPVSSASPMPATPPPPDSAPAAVNHGPDSAPAAPNEAAINHGPDSAH